MAALEGSPPSDLEMASPDSEVGMTEEIPTVLEPGPSNRFSEVRVKKSKESEDPAKCSVCKEAAGKHSYYGRALFNWTPNQVYVVLTAVLLISTHLYVLTWVF